MATWYRISELKSLPPVTWLIPDYLQANTVAQLGGPSGAAKTFVYVDWGCRLACEGRKVAFLLGEGLPGMYSRLDAWQNHHSYEVPNDNLFVRGGIEPLPRAQRVKTLVTELKRFGTCDFVVLDTFARAMAGFDENSTADVSAAMENMRHIQDQTGGTCLAVAHFGWDGKRQRGNSAFYGACDSVVYLDKVARKAKKAEQEESDEEGYSFEPPAPPSRRSKLWVDKHRDASTEIEPVYLERYDVPGTGSCVYLPVKKGAHYKAETNGHGEVVDLRKFPEKSIDLHT